MLERNLLGLRGGGGGGNTTSRENSAAPSLQNSATSLGSAGSGGSTRPRLVRGGDIIPSGSPERNRHEVAPFVKANCRPVSRETGEYVRRIGEGPSFLQLYRFMERELTLETYICRVSFFFPVTLLHPGEYYDKLRATSKLDESTLHQMTLATLNGEDVYYHSDTFLAATLACGGVVECVDAVLGGAGIGNGGVYGTTIDNDQREEEEGNESPRDVTAFDPASSIVTASSTGSNNGSGVNGNSSVDAPHHLKGASTSRAFAVVRPPGHHACQSRSMGFCFLNSVAVAAKHGLIRHSDKCKRVLILDWDVHHGNGTQDLTYDDPNILYVSLHRIAKQGSNTYFFPGTGRPEEVGHGPAEGSNLNVAWDVKKIGNVEYAAAFSELILPLVSAFDPSLIMISSGFDAAQGDLIGDCLLSPEMYYRMTRSLLVTAGVDVPMVVALEGGYNLSVISNCAEAVALALLDEPWDHRLEATSVAEQAQEVPIAMSASDEQQYSPSTLPHRDEAFRSSVDSKEIAPDVVRDTSMRSIGAFEREPSFNASTVMESIRHIIDGDDNDNDGGRGGGDDDDSASSTSSLDINSSHRHLKAAEGDDPAAVSGRMTLEPTPLVPPPPTAEERLRAGRMELASLWNFESPSPKMKGMGAKKNAIRCINQSIRAIRNTSRWVDGSKLQLKEIVNQSEFVPIIQTRNRRGVPLATHEEMNASFGNLGT